MDKKQKYIRRLFAPEDSRLQEIVTNTHEITNNIQINPEDGKFLQLLIKLGNIKKIVEIGTLGGYSSTWMSRALPKEGHIYTIERDNSRFKLAKQNLKNADKITILEGFANDILPTLEDKAPFDMIFIDADKRGYPDYLDWAEKHIRKCGLIIADNTFLSGAVYMDKNAELPYRIKQSTLDIMLKFNERLADPEKYCSLAFPTHDGFTVAIKLF